MTRHFTFTIPFELDETEPEVTVYYSVEMQNVFDLRSPQAMDRGVQRMPNIEVLYYVRDDSHRIDSDGTPGLWEAMEEAAWHDAKR